MKRGRKPEVDVDVCVELYRRLSTVESVVKMLQAKKLVNPRTRKPYSYHTIYGALRNDERFKVLQAKQRSAGMEQFNALRKELGIG